MVPLAQRCSRLVKWTQHLDLSTDFTKYRAYIYSSPTVVDIDNDGNLEIIVGTSVGFLYVLDNTGQPREGWPVQMGEIQGQPLAADLNGDGFMEVNSQQQAWLRFPCHSSCTGRLWPQIFAADTRGNIALFNYKGHELWERHVGSLVAQMATAGDVNGDGKLEIVFGTGSGHIYVISGSTGEVRRRRDFVAVVECCLNTPSLLSAPGTDRGRIWHHSHSGQGGA